MAHPATTTRLRRELLVKTAEALRAGDLPGRVDRFPLELRPRGETALRCCVHRERAVLRYRAMALLGFSVQDEEDELRPLAHYARDAQARTSRDPRLLTVIEEACSACVRAAYFVSNACRGCAAQSCAVACPKQAITVRDGQSAIDPARCVNCGKCKDVCAFNAILRIPIPCEEACPVQAIVRGPSGKQEIRHDLCIACGKCMQACPFGAVAEQSEVVEVLGALAEGRPLVALFAPALAAQFQAPLEHLVGALRRLGFAGTVEVAAGADLAAQAERRELEEAPFLTSSCCPAYTGLVASRLPALAPRVSTTPTPLAFAAKLAAQRFPGLPRVFLSPCVAKRREALGGSVEHVLTFEELGAALVAWGIEVDACPPSPADIPATDRGRAFAAAGGVAAAVGADAEVLCGLGAETQRRLRLYASGKGPARFLEVMACEGGCIAGPCTLADPKVARRRIPAAPDRDPGRPV
ncbi:[Fe-Fe] hydrogenase large subunit C-terminal domain-containing protein [Mesoterricola silvestris]|uniref:Hydrogenase n=1 Tax=Mesoterricola silvestris TaxID=2927979 RepID=A0AA48K7P2_9BACT|nr:[Fe-Fe] hydrogenase large subunit C-terminal domain-containing protein [Mesoterricola silvestris]BDU71330.1 hydrogenase [Mesoterricola silvestris]